MYSIDGRGQVDMSTRDVEGPRPTSREPVQCLGRRCASSGPVRLVDICGGNLDFGSFRVSWLCSCPPNAMHSLQLARAIDNSRITASQLTFTGRIWGERTYIHWDTHWDVRAPRKKRRSEFSGFTRYLPVVYVALGTALRSRLQLERSCPTGVSETRARPLSSCWPWSLVEYGLRGTVK